MNDQHTRHPSPRHHPPVADQTIIAKGYDEKDREIVSSRESYLAWFDMSYEQRKAHLAQACHPKKVHHVRWMYERRPVKAQQEG